jgi:Na+/H+-dicarboxylate symporter
MKKLSLAGWIFIGLLLGIGAGLLLMNNTGIAENYIAPWGTLFLNLIKFIVIPVVLLSIIMGVVSQSDIKQIGAIGWKTIVYYICTTTIAISIGLLVSNLFKGGYKAIKDTGVEFTPSDPVSPVDTVLNMFPKNIIEPFLNATMLQIIVISLLVGFAIVLVGEKAAPAKNLIDSFCEVSLKIMEFIIKLSPIGIFCLITPVVALNGPTILGSLAMVLGVAYLSYIIHMVATYSASVAVFAKMSPIKFFKGMWPMMVMAFSSASSMATLPLNMQCTQKLGVKPSVSSFVLPLGATINMDGTAIYQGVCSIFIAQCFGIDLTFMQMLTIVLTATLASIGTAGVPGSGMIMLAMVLESVGMPVEGIALVAGVDRIFDMGRTTVNVTGDAACTICINAIETRRLERKALKAQKA